MNRYESVDEVLDDIYDAYLHVGDEDDENLYYLSDFDAPDLFTLLRTGDGKTVLLVSTLEYGRAKKESNADEVRNTNEFFDGDRRGDPEARVDALAAFLDEYDASDIAVPRDFSLHTAGELRERGYGVETVADPVSETRAVKDEDEIKKIRSVQRANEDATHRAQTLLKEAKTETRGGEDVLVHDSGLLTAERVKTEIEVALVRERCSLDTTIVACGERGADPHWRGEGPLRPDEPIIVDIFPRGESKYFADMTRTFVVGEPSESVREMYELTLEAQEAAFEVLSRGADAGITGEDVHDAVCDVYEEAGYGTVREGDETGFIHSTGHGVGLDIHENPRLSAGGDELRAGNVVTVEPGLYLPEVGGVRVEDFVVVSGDGYENLTDYPKGLTI